MKFGDALKQFAEKKLKPYIVFYGEEEYLKYNGLQAALDALDIGTPELNLSLFEERPDGRAVAVAMETLPFMSENKAVLIKNTDILSSASSAEYTEPLGKVHMPASNYLIIVAKGKVDKRKAFYKKLAKEGMMVECDPLGEYELIAFAVNAAFKDGLILSKDNAQVLCEYCGGDLSTVVNELQKLSSICEGNITPKEIEKYVSKSVQFNVFKIHDLLCAGKLPEAMALIDRMLLDDPNPIGFIGLIAGNFKQMLVARACREAGFAPNKTIAHIMDETGVKEWAAKRALSNCRSYGLPALRAGVKKLGRMDYMAKQGEVVLKTDLFPLLVDIYKA